jgi:hypothetical protein
MAGVEWLEPQPSVLGDLTGTEAHFQRAMMMGVDQAAKAMRDEGDQR